MVPPKTTRGSKQSLHTHYCDHVRRSRPCRVANLLAAFHFDLQSPAPPRTQRPIPPSSPSLPPPTPPRIFCVTKLSTPETRPRGPRTRGCGNRAGTKKKPRGRKPRKNKMPIHPCFRALGGPSSPVRGAQRRPATRHHTKEAAAITPSEGHPPHRPLPHSRAAFHLPLTRACTHRHANAAWVSDKNPSRARPNSQGHKGPLSRTSAPRPSPPAAPMGHKSSRGSRVRASARTRAPSPSARLRTHTQKPPLCSARGQYRRPSWGPCDSHNQHSGHLPVSPQPRDTDTR